MRFVVDPAIATKIARMKERVRWQHPAWKEAGVDQTCLEIVDRITEENQTTAENNQDFSFLVVGDSGTSRHVRDSPQRRVTKRLLQHSSECDFILHTGDVVYLVGSSEQYPDNFIKPYREFLVGGKESHKIRFDQMVFKLPFLPVLGNHDYYDLPLVSGILSKALTPIRKLLRRRINFDVGWHGSYQGEGFARAFLDFAEPLSPRQLKAHLQAHYTAKKGTGYCLRYVPGEFTRLPNRYYTFRKNGIDFFALDSNTFNAPQPLPPTEEGFALREKIEKQRDELDEQMRSLALESATLNTDIPEQSGRSARIYAKMEQIDEQLQDIDKQLNASLENTTVDTEQLDWLRDRLIASWQDPTAKGRVLYFHHPPYVTESTKWFQGQTLAVRVHLREVLDDVQREIKEYTRPLVDLVLSGHAHCFEYLKTLETGHGDRTIPWIVCGGSGFSLRRQRKEGAVLEEFGEPVAKCHLFMGREGHGSKTRRPYTALRVDVKYGGQAGDSQAGETESSPDNRPQFVLRTLVAERFDSKWKSYELDPIVL
ncbi:metallophosphoesterase [cf. Phormidesmis sp. LEGE 11477]|uniref:metallophosphoesterase family protein n=1 Tax=cf. Phormidesmis sp. LEGE 11477 TaxID=1828680 RepID=UPI001881B067|nr:metallophosphoesterase [cf. Phormidesmis sp. LEGE 11477]MBE9064400.1 metallophosphoesterase [cf. Phormidesmis sp. LEGE 11477]